MDGHFIKIIAFYDKIVAQIEKYIQQTSCKVHCLSKLAVNEGLLIGYNKLSVNLRGEVICAHVASTAYSTASTTTNHSLIIINKISIHLIPRGTSSDSVEAFMKGLTGETDTFVSKYNIDNPYISGGYSSYIRWGRKTCPANRTELTYSGFAGGSFYADRGGAGFLCLSGEPVWDHYDDAVQASARIYGTEYELDGERSFSSAFFGPNLHDNDVPCAVCTTRRTTNIMIPGRNRCMAGWTEEYHGYLVAGHFGHPSATEYLCLDKQPEVILGGNQNSNGALLYMVEGICGSLECPPYVNGRELTCVVCSK